MQCDETMQVGLHGSCVCVYESIDNFVMQCDETMQVGLHGSCVCVYESIDNFLMQCDDETYHAGRAAQ